MSLQVFDFGGRKVRTEGTHESPLFCAADVCAVLGYADVSQACEKLDQDESVQVGAENGSRRVLYSGPNANMFVTESGLFSLIMRSSKVEAKAFKRWVTSEVLPAIRKHGFYSAVQAEHDKQTELLLAQCFPHLPSKSAPIFRDLIASLLRLRRERGPSNPAWARKLASMIYGWAIVLDGQQSERRKRNPRPGGSRTDHSMFSEKASASVQRVVQTGTDFARISSSWDDWKVKMELAFGKKALQLPFLVSMRQLPPKGLS